MGRYQKKIKKMKLFSLVCGSAMGAGSIYGPMFTGNNWWPWVFGGQGIWKSNQPADPCDNPTIWGTWGGWGECDSTGSRWREAPCLLNRVVLHFVNFNLWKRRLVRNQNQFRPFMEHGVNIQFVIQEQINNIELDNVLLDHVPNHYLKKRYSNSNSSSILIWFNRNVSNRQQAEPDQY